MMLDGRSSDIPDRLITDICIIGAGAVGIPLAREFLQAKTRVIIVESGDEEGSDDTQALCAMGVSGIVQEDGPDVSRLRHLGGSSNHWGGWNRPYSRRTVDAWPVDYDDFAAYIDRTSDVLGLRRGDFDRIEEWGEAEGQYFASMGPGIRTVARQIHAFRLWPSYRAKFLASQAVQVLKNSNLVDLIFSPNGERVTAAKVRTLEGHERRISARHFVIACGGLENPQILLNVDRTSNGLLSGKAAGIGQYYMDHPELFGEIVPFKCLTPAMFHQEVEVDGWHRFIDARPEHSLDTDLETYRHLPAHAFRLDNPVPQCSYRTREEHENFRATLAREGVDGEGGLCEVNVLSAHAALNYAPDPVASSRITLTDERNALGTFGGHLHWQMAANESQRAYEVAREFELRMAQNGIGRIRLSHWLKPNGWTNENGRIYNGRHHMGATRMSASPRDGVVDANCRVHGLDNLFVAGASVFPTYDWPGPTFTAIALALRLADHLKRRVASGA